MGIFSSIGTAIGGYFGGPTGAAIGSAAGGYIDDSGTRSQNKAAKTEAQGTQDFQERMSSTAYQRSMADMKKAGLNPILAYKQGSASTPGGVTPPVLNEMAGRANSARTVNKNVAEIKEINARKKNVEAETRLKNTTSAYTTELYHSAYSKAQVDRRQSNLMAKWLDTPEGKKFWLLLFYSFSGVC